MAEVSAQLRPGEATRIRMVLEPGHLGELLIELSMRGSVLHGRILVETDAARDLLLSRLDELRDALEGQGIDVGGFQVEVDGAAFLPEEMPAAPLRGGVDAEPEARLLRDRGRVLDVLA